ncbi:MAG: transcription antitermination factor NusB [Rhodospirillales bacterium]|jgi:N utilization substance protein B|nr:transcription antitermination factor NusB [Rhodospirillales bacterium]MBT4007139.1 transcription antitermination factor NusB [Rhodospirillales bacterium]MBT5076686.1 transcription antitermination factor NusB [Rhodospirillales bacterium]MBT5113472.1 transcription antitermination factor NusB [Rhodospirillales bacterium]MBT5673770.1 transcription antitermination factor NusB [Rhodospirillales bacterium]
MSEKNETGAKRRTTARLSAVQALYQIELTSAPVEQVIEEFTSPDRPVPDGEDAEQAEIVRPAPKLFAEIVRGVSAKRGALDNRIKAALSAEWRLERLEILVRLILEAAIYELVERDDIPPKVVMNEYLNVAHGFFAGSEPGFINGILNAIAKDKAAAKTAET